jgi:hypothetical protein
MSGVVRLLLIWFIAAAVPLKGLAAVTMGGCGPEHHSPREAAATVAHATHGDFHEIRHELGSGMSLDPATSGPGTKMSRPGSIHRPGIRRS